VNFTIFGFTVGGLYLGKKGTERKFGSLISEFNYTVLKQNQNALFLFKYLGKVTDHFQRPKQTIQETNAINKESELQKKC
jgi:hypothetical protein